MWLCDECHKDCGEYHQLSFGRCENCGKNKECYDCEGHKQSKVQMKYDPVTGMLKTGELQTTICSLNEFIARLREDERQGNLLLGLSCLIQYGGGTYRIVLGGHLSREGVQEHMQAILKSIQEEGKSE